MIIKGVRLGGVTVSDASIVSGDQLLYLDASNDRSYPGSGTTWSDLSDNSNNVTGLTGYTYSTNNRGYVSFNGAGAGSLVSNKYNVTYTGKTVFVAGNLTAIADNTYRAMIGSSAGGRNFNFYWYRSGSTYRLHYSSGGVGFLTNPLNYTPGNWFTTAFTHATNGNCLAYLNGQQVFQTSQSFFQYQSGSTENIARADNFWFGALAVVVVYSRELSPDEISINHNAVRERYGLASSM